MKHPYRQVIRFLIVTFFLLGLPLFLLGCTDDAKIASLNISRSADLFEVDRRVIFYNGITGGYILTIEDRPEHV